MNWLRIVHGAYDMMRRLSYRKDWALRPSQYPLCYGSQHQPVKSSQPVSSHHDQIRCLRFSQREDQIRYSAILHKALGPDLGPCMALRKFLKLLLSVGAAFPTDLFISV
jgi:hypothetical protein